MGRHLMSTVRPRALRPALPRATCTSGTDARYDLVVDAQGFAVRLRPAAAGPYRVAALGQPLPETDWDLSDPVCLIDTPEGRALLDLYPFEPEDFPPETA
jgi:hypothetical protein